MVASCAIPAGGCRAARFKHGVDLSRRRSRRSIGSTLSEYLCGANPRSRLQRFTGCAADNCSACGGEHRVNVANSPSTSTPGAPAQWYDCLRHSKHTTFHPPAPSPPPPFPGRPTKALAAHTALLPHPRLHALLRQQQQQKPHHRRDHLRPRPAACLSPHRLSAGGAEASPSPPRRFRSAFSQHPIQFSYSAPRRRPATGMQRLDASSLDAKRYSTVGSYGAGREKLRGCE